MANANYIMIDGVAYSPKHPKAKALAGSVERDSPLASPPPQAACARQPARILSAEDKLNQTERMFLVLLRAQYGPSCVRIQSIRLELAPNCCYTPDFSVWREKQLTFYEVKGAFIRDDAIVKLKTAARLYPEFDFYLCQWKNHRWTERWIPK